MKCKHCKFYCCGEKRFCIVLAYLLFEIRLDEVSDDSVVFRDDSSECEILNLFKD